MKLMDSKNRICGTEKIKVTDMEVNETFSSVSVDFSVE